MAAGIKNSGADLVFASANYGVLFPPPQMLLVQGEIYLNPIYRERSSNLSWREQMSAFAAISC